MGILTRGTIIPPADGVPTWRDQALVLAIGRAGNCMTSMTQESMMTKQRSDIKHCEEAK